MRLHAIVSGKPEFVDSPALRALIVDDEPLARRILGEELEAFPQIVVVGEAGDGREALQTIERLRPDLVFLDLQMPVMSGFEVVQNLAGDRIPIIIIVTAFDEYAIKAFDTGAIDYLLKPVSKSRLEKAVDRACSLRDRRAEIAARAERIARSGARSRTPTARKVVGRIGEDYVVLDMDEVLAFQAERELVWIITATSRLLSTQSLAVLQHRLAQSKFQRVHRNAIVNINHVYKLSPLSSQRWLITLSNGLELVASKRQARNIRSLLRW